MTEAEAFSLSITKPKGRRTGAFDWLTGGKPTNILAKLCSISTVNILFQPCEIDSSKSVNSKFPIIVWVANKVFGLMLGFLHCEVLKVENNREAKYPPLILENLKPLRKKNSSATEDDTPD